MIETQRCGHSWINISGGAFPFHLLCSTVKAFSNGGAMLFLLAFACTKSSKEVDKTANEDVRSTNGGVESLGEPEDSVCRAFATPVIDAKGCVVAGPYQGILEGYHLSEELNLEQAIEACIGNPKCSGISTDWYSDTPFVAVKKTAPFRVDSDSYGCTFIVTCSD